jgi:Ni,Fe-hydrogenase maturation factor
MILIIAFGNDLREDDGAGLWLAGLMQEAWQANGVVVRRIAVQQLAPELAVDIVEDGVSAVVFVDTRVVRSPADCEITVTPVAIPGSGAAAVGHRFDPGLVLAYAAALAPEKVPPAWLVTTPGTRFGYGQSISADASGAIVRGLQDQNGALWRLLRAQTDATRP